jgi:membrane-bound lytic murein transglycosylase B
MRFAVLLICVALAGCSDDPAPKPAQTAPAATPAATSFVTPEPGEPIPGSPAKLAARLAEVDTHMRAHLQGDITLEALYEQRVYRHLSRRGRLERAVRRRVPARMRPDVRDTVSALRSLFRLTTFSTERRFRTGPPTPRADLLRYYREAQRRFGVRWNVLAAINFIESNFGRLRNVSNAGAVGPMQFIPSTWAAYGMGGDIRDPHDAVLGAANYLHANGAPGNYPRAVYHYNPSPLYVNSVLSYARAIRRNPETFVVYWSWQSFMRTPSGDVQLTGPGS